MFVGRYEGGVHVPTITQLPNAVQTVAQDELPISQAGVTRAVTVAELLSGTQQIIEISSPSILGRASPGPGGPEALSIGVGISLVGAAVVATGGDHGGFVQDTSIGPGDEVIVNASGVPKRLAIPALRSLFTGGVNVTIDASGVVAAHTDMGVTANLSTLSQGVASAQAGIAALTAKIPAGGFAGLNASGQVTAPVAGDVSTATVVRTGAVTVRSLASRVSDTANVLDFGATLGGPDCSAAFNAAFAQLSSGGGEITIPAGDYWLQSTLLLTGKSLRIRGVGKGLT